MKSQKNPLAKPILITTPYKQENIALQGEARSLFAQPNRPLYVDLGAGRGQFLDRASRMDPNSNWIGIEKKTVHLFQALRKRKINPYSNLRYIWMSIEQIGQVFAKGEVNRFYLNFSTPWEDDSFAKKRLTYRRFLNMYRDLLAPDGDIIFKTDHIGLYEFSLQELRATGWEILEETDDLHSSQWNEKNITTEWEDKVSTSCGICYLRARPN